MTLNNFSRTVNLPFNPLHSAGVLKGSKVKICSQAKTILSTTKNNHRLRTEIHILPTISIFTRIIINLRPAIINLRPTEINFIPT